MIKCTALLFVVGFVVSASVAAGCSSEATSPTTPPPDGATLDARSESGKLDGADVVVCPPDGSSAKGTITAKIDGVAMTSPATVNFRFAGVLTSDGFTSATDEAMPGVNPALQTCTPGTYSGTVGPSLALTVFDGARRWGCGSWVTIEGTSCTITITEFGGNPGDAIRGTFSGTLGAMDSSTPAGTRTITEGTFAFTRP